MKWHGGSRQRVKRMKKKGFKRQKLYFQRYSNSEDIVLKTSIPGKASPGKQQSRDLLNLKPKKKANGPNCSNGTDTEKQAEHDMLNEQSDILNDVKTKEHISTINFSPKDDFQSPAIRRTTPSHVIFINNCVVVDEQDHHLPLSELPLELRKMDQSNLELHETDTSNLLLLSEATSPKFDDQMVDHYRSLGERIKETVPDPTGPIVHTEFKAFVQLLQTITASREMWYFEPSAFIHIYKYALTLRTHDFYGLRKLGNSDMCSTSSEEAPGRMIFEKLTHYIGSNSSKEQIIELDRQNFVQSLYNVDMSQLPWMLEIIRSVETNVRRRRRHFDIKVCPKQPRTITPNLIDGSRAETDMCLSEKTSNDTPKTEALYDQNKAWRKIDFKEDVEFVNRSVQVCMKTKNLPHMSETKKVQTINLDIEKEEYLEQLEAAMKMRAAAIEQLRRVHSENENTLIWNNVLLGCVKEETGH